MGKARYTILRRTVGGDRIVGSEQFGDRPEPARDAQLSVIELDEKQAAEVRADPGNVVARGYRTKLIRPRSQAEAASVDDWGIAAVGADSSSMTGQGVVVAVLDTGIDAAHEAFRDVAIEEKDFSGSGDGDRDGHGTHCAGTIFGGDVEGRRIGVAPGVRRGLIGKILDDHGMGDATMMFDGLRWALQNGAHVVSLSIGFDFPGEVADRIADGWLEELAVSEALDGFRENLDMMNAVMAQFSADLSGARPLVVAASGNESLRDSNPHWRISTSLPAAAAHISVAALGRSGSNYEVASFSNSKAKVAAPGVEIVSAHAGGGLIAESGTSMACPHVAGVAALWAEKVRNSGDVVTAEILSSHLLANATRDSIVAGDVIDVGRGLVRAPD